jgi:phosphohistidine phosphatase
MKTLILFRHGKSDWTAGGLDDHERPLAKRGIKASGVMGKFLQKARQIPQAALTSSALRARSSLELAFEGGGWKCPVRVTNGLYDVDPEDVLGEIQQEPDTTERLLLVGHQPTWSQFASLMIGGGDIGMPTACLLRMDFDCNSWSMVRQGSGKLIWVVPPRLFTDGDIQL